MSDQPFLKLDSQLFQMNQSASNRTLAVNTSKQNPNEGSDAELKKATEQFEALLLNMMIREMRETIPESKLFPESMAKEIYTGMLDEQIADSMSERGGIGISRMLFDQLKGK